MKRYSHFYNKKDLTCHLLASMFPITYREQVTPLVDLLESYGYITRDGIGIWIVIKSFNIRYGGLDNYQCRFTKKMRFDVAHIHEFRKSAWGILKHEYAKRFP